MYFLKFTIQFIVILNIAINSIGFRYHCIGRNDKPPCFLDMIPWEHSYKKVLSKFLLPIDLEYFQNLFYRAMYRSRYLYSVNDLLKLLLTDDQVRKIYAILRVQYKYSSYIKVHITNKHYKNAPGYRDIIKRRNSMF